MVNKIVRESEKQFPFATQSVIHKSYKKYISGNLVRLAQIKSHPIKTSDSAGKEPSSSKFNLRGKVQVHPSFIVSDQNDIANVLIALSSSCNTSSTFSSSSPSTDSSASPAVKRKGGCSHGTTNKKQKIEEIKSTVLLNEIAEEYLSEKKECASKEQYMKGEDRMRSLKSLK